MQFFASRQLWRRLRQPRREPPTGPRFAPANFKPGGKIEQGCGGSSPLLCERSIPALHHPSVSCGGNKRPRCFAIALPFELQQLAPPAGVEPATDVTRAFTTPQTLQTFVLLPSLLPSLVNISLAHTCSVSFLQGSTASRNPGGTGAHGETAFPPGEHCVLPKPKK